MCVFLFLLSSISFLRFFSFGYDGDDNNAILNDDLISISCTTMLVGAVLSEGEKYAKGGAMWVWLLG
jgi:hypothetical protein